MNGHKKTSRRRRRVLRKRAEYSKSCKVTGPKEKKKEEERKTLAVSVILQQNSAKFERKQLSHFLSFHTDSTKRNKDLHSRLEGTRTQQAR